MFHYLHDRKCRVSRLIVAAACFWSIGCGSDTGHQTDSDTGASIAEVITDSESPATYVECADDTDCEGSTACVLHLGELVCAPKCGDGCPGGWVCDVERCQSLYPSLCRPCTQHMDCQDNPSGAQCIHYAGLGGFCGSGCGDDTHCPSGYECQLVETITGGQASQCTPKSGTCTCTSAARRAGWSAWCQPNDSPCAGTRQCSPDGMSMCVSTTPTLEECNGRDDDCNGIVDDIQCDDGNDCTEDFCGGESGCQSEPLDGQSCGGLCLAGGICQEGECVGGEITLCDDDDVCTSDTCEPSVGCIFTPIEECAPSGPCEAGIEADGCTPGDVELDTQECGNCGSQTRERTCTDRCNWSDWSDWSACNGGVCSPGDMDVQSEACGTCGTRERTRICTDECAWPSWGSWGPCGGEGVCSPGAVDSQTQSCGNCGNQVRTRTCTSSCSWDGWSGWSTCAEQGVCSPGATESQSQGCGNCGAQTRTRTCSASCAWSSWSAYGACSGEGVCAPGAVNPNESACNDQCAAQICNTSCQWDPCGLKPGAECFHEGGTNYQCCGSGKWQFCLPAIYGCKWSSSCESCSGCGC